ncbi:MAG: hypothetical protein M5U01_18015 [Ardenticatenaceae bacterium]|nr:hypothetical protein [Ardenticatenaceae bacterium]
MTGLLQGNSRALRRLEPASLGARASRPPAWPTTTAQLAGEDSGPALPGGASLLRRLFEPPGYTVAGQPHPLDEQFSEWGASSYFTVELQGRVRLRDLLRGNGVEGIVVKPFDFIVTGRRGLVQPAVKCRGREYLRIIYGPEYTAPENLERLRSRGLSAKRSLALREFALGIEALERFVRGEPLRRVHESVFGVLALESEPVDPRL